MSLHLSRLPCALQDQTFPFVPQGSVVSLTNVANVKVRPGSVQVLALAACRFKTTWCVQGTGNAISNPLKCGYISSTPYTVSGTYSNVQCC